MSIPTLFRSDDTGAPTLSGTVGTLNDVLNACLVDGYGSKSPLGWTKEFENVAGDVTVYRSSTAIDKQYLRVAHLDDGTSGPRVADLSVYETMSDEDTGTGNWANVHAAISNVETSSAKAWFLYGDDTGFWLHVVVDSASASDFTYSASYDQNYYFGDLVRADGSDTNTCVLSGGTGDSYTSSGLNNRMLEYVAGSSTTYVHKDLAGSATSTLISAAVFSVAGNTNAFANSSGTLGVTGSQRIFMIPPIYDGTGHFRGTLPGLHCSSVINDYDDRDNLANVEGDFYHVHITQGASSFYVGYLLNDGTDWRA